MKNETASNWLFGVMVTSTIVIALWLISVSA